MKNKRKLKRKYKLLGNMFILLILIFIVSKVYVETFYDTKESPKEALFKEQIEEETIKEHNLSMIMVGDALIHRSIYVEAKQADGSYDFRKIFKYIKPIVMQYDLAFYNQETILGGAEMGLSTYPTFNSPYEIGDAFLDSGFNIVSLANNHTLDRGAKAVINSREYWNKQDVLVSGSARTQEERDELIIKEKNGIKYSLLAYTTSTNGIRSPNDYYVNIYSDAQAKKDIERLRDEVDFLFVSMHWGIEYYPGVSASQKQIAEYLSSLGVDIIIGHHPHVVEPVEFIGDTLVIYSLGNFVSSQIGPDKLTGAMISVNLKLTEDSGIKTKSIEDVEAELIYTYYQNVGGVNKSYLVYPYAELNEAIFPEYKKYYEIIKERLTRLDKNIIVR